jgi:branched-chain amino acid transport system substrate-binding protein
MKKYPVALVSFSIYGAIACGVLVYSRSAQTADPAPAPSAAAPLTRDAAEFKDIFDLYSRGDYETALKRLTAFERYFPNSKLQASAENLHGMIYLLQKQPAPAIPHFGKASTLPSDQPNFGQYALYNLATAQFEANQLDDAQETLNDIHIEVLDKDNQLKTHYLKARVFQKRSLPVEAARECLLSSKVGSNPAVTSLLEMTLNDVSSSATLSEMYTSYQDTPLADVVLYHLATTQLKEGDRTKAQQNFQLLLTKYPQSAHAAQATEALRSEQNLGPVEKMSVGVLLPLKGKFGRFGSHTLEAIELAFGIFGDGPNSPNSKDDKNSKITLVIEDSGEEPEQAVAALEKLANQHRVVAVIGPLLSKGIDQVAQRAQELGVPLISLARSTPANLTTYSKTSGNSFFQAGVTLQEQTDQIAKFAVDQLKLSRFAEVYPKDKVGVESGNLFWDSVEQLGGKMVGAESYAPDETDFRQVIDKLSGLYYTEARQKELDELAKERVLNHIKKRTRKTEQYFSLKPIVDYQAVFIPEEAKATGQILPTFAYRDVDHIRFLGTAAWNSPELYQRAQNYADGVLFTDAFFAMSSSPLSEHFVTLYRSTFNVDPTTMEAVAYDAARVLDHALTDGSAPDRSDLKDRLRDIKDYPSVTGKITVTNGQFARELKVLTIKQGKIVEFNSAVASE